MKLKGKVAIVTGSSQGIGKSYVKCLIEEGAKVVVADINREKGEVVEQQFKQSGFDVQFIQVDVKNPESVKRLVDITVQTYGKIDILINNASIFSTIKTKPFEQLSLDEWNKVIGVNLTGTFLCCQAVVPIMRNQNSGRIINISSGTVLYGRPYYIHYVSSKAGVAGFTRALAREVGSSNITVNTLTPGPIATEIERDSAPPGMLQSKVMQQCIQRQGTPEDLTGTIVFLCSDDSSFITGQMIVVDGGKDLH